MSEMKKAITPKFRVSFPSVFKASAYGQQEPKFSITMLFDKSADLKELKALANAAAVAKWGDKIPKNMRSPFRDGDEKGDTDGYSGKVFIRASSKNKPKVVDQNIQEILDETEFYAGCYARASLTAYAYDQQGNKGVAFGLLNVQKLGEGEPFGVASDPNKDFFDGTPIESVDSEEVDGVPF